VPRKPDMQKRRDIALQALDIIQKRGVHRTTMSDLAQALKMKRPTLYWYFHDLGEVLDAVIEETYQELGAFLTRRIPDIDHPIDFLEGLLAAELEFIREHSQRIMIMLQLWAATSAANPERALVHGRQFLEPLRAQLITRVKNGIESGLVRPCNAEGLVDTMLCIGDGATIQYIALGTDLERLFNTVKFLLNAMRTRTPEAPTGQ